MGKYSVPTEVAAAIDFVEGISEFPMHRSSGRKKPFNLESTATIQMVSPQTIRGMYRVPADPVTTASQAPAEFQGDASYNKNDLAAFLTQMDLPNVTFGPTIGPYDGTYPDTEATLDMQYIVSAGEGQSDWYWTSDNWMYQWAHTFFNTTKVPDAVSISWGWAEDGQCSPGIDQAECQTLGVSSSKFVERVNTEFQKIGLRGVSLFVASGDSGANGRSDDMCTDTVLHASFPASSPYVTAVGATMLKDPKFALKNPPEPCSSQGSSYMCASSGTEVCVSFDGAGFTSGGGFSTYSPMPPYQETAVSSYLQSGTQLPPASYFNKTHRAYPDVSALGNNFLIYIMGSWSLVGGTSASAPTFAGVCAYMNDVSIKETGKPLGFLNPLLYQMHEAAPDAFTDVTMGDNKCTEYGCAASCKGYEAAKGWDPVSGLGTPVADKMISYVLSLLERRKSDSVVV